MKTINEMNEIIDAATPGPWESPWIGDHANSFTDAEGKDVISIMEHDGEPLLAVLEHNAAFVQTFNPQTMRELIDKYEKYEQALKCLASYYETGFGIDPHKEVDLPMVIDAVQRIAKRALK